jgi:hypothetical protein
MRNLHKPCTCGGAPEAAPRAKIWISPPFCPESGDAEAMAERLYKVLTKGKTPAPKGTTPHLVLSAGPPGAGKTSVARLLVKHRSDFPLEAYLEFDSDALYDLAGLGAATQDLRDVHGQLTGIGYALGWNMCDATAVLAQRLVQRLIHERYHLIVHYHNPEVVLPTAQNAGYVCTLLYVVVTLETALRRAAHRAEELGRFLRPGPADDWGWKDAGDYLQKRYRLMVPWYALWADNLVVVLNEVDGAEPGADDFRAFICHPPVPADMSWQGVIGTLYEAVEEAHAEAAKVRAEIEKAGKKQRK